MKFYFKTFIWILACSITATLSAQNTDIVAHNGIKTELHKANIGKITFMPKMIPFAEYTEADFLKSLEMKSGNDLYIRVFLGNSLTNYMHEVRPDLSAAELTAQGNFQFSFRVDGALVYQENLNVGAGAPEWKNTATSFSVPLMTVEKIDSWGRFLWMRFMVRGGQEALTPGKHLMKIVLKPYVDAGELAVGETIATGEIELVVPEIFVHEKKIAIQKIKPGSGWQLSKATYDTSLIRALNKQIASNTYKNVTSIVVLKNGELLLEEYFNKAKRKKLHDTRSVGKSFASTMTGIALADGHLQSEFQQLREFYHLQDYANYAPQKDSISIYNLLTMSSALDGFDFDDDSPGNENNMYPTKNWVKFALDLSLNPDKKNDAQWAYFTAGVVILGDILHQVVPGGLEKYAEQKLFAPLGIENYKWQQTPQKVANTAGGLRMSSLDFAKFGQLYQNQGVWNGHQILPEAWVQKSLSQQIALPEMENEFYGYLFWNKTYSVDGKDYEVYYSSGNGGNKIFIFKDQPIVIVITATAYNTAFGHVQPEKMMQQYLIPALFAE